MHLKVTIHNRAYTSWEFTQDDVKVDIPHLIPSKHKLLHDDIIHFKPAKNSIRTADLYSSWFVTDNNLNPRIEQPLVAPRVTAFGSYTLGSD